MRLSRPRNEQRQRWPRARTYRKTQSSARLAAQAANNAIVSVVWIRWQAVWLMMLMGRKASGDSSRRVPREIFDIFFALHESFTTQGTGSPPIPVQPEAGCCVR